MKLFFVIDSLGPGGAEKSMVDLAIFLKKKGHEISFNCIDRREVSFEADVKARQIPIHYFKNKNLLFRAKEFAERCKQEKPDIVHSVLIRSNLISRFSRIFFSSTYYIESLVNLSYSKTRVLQNDLPIHKYFLVKNLDKWSARIFPAYYHSISFAVFHNYRKLYKINDNYQVIYRGRKSNERNKNLAENPIRLINVGRQEFAKGQINLLKAISILKKKNNVNLRLGIYGHEGKATQELLNFIKKNSLEDCVEINGFVRNVEDKLKNSDIFLFPSYHEGLGGALIEAFATGLPCICSDIPVLRELSGEENEAAIFVDPENHKDFASEILQLCENELLRKKLAKRAKLRFKEEFQLQVINRKMLDLYTNVLRKYANENSSVSY